MLALLRRRNSCNTQKLTTPTPHHARPLQVQLILPEALKLLPLYSLALHKSAMMRPDVRADDRSAWLAGIVAASPQRTMGLLHPRLFAVHNLLVRQQGR